MKIQGLKIIDSQASLIVIFFVISNGVRNLFDKDVRMNENIFKIFCALIQILINLAFISKNLLYINIIVYLKIFQENGKKTNIGTKRNGS
jgi:hypothetical protein